MKNKMIILVIILLIIVLVIVKNAMRKDVAIIGGSDGPTAIFIKDNGGNPVNTYKNITMAEAKEVFKTGGDYIILDVRRADEYESGHIPGAINYANEDISDKALDILPDLDQLIYVYCRSGNRSKQAASKLVAIGYTNIVEFGGIIDWTGEIEK